MHPQDAMAFESLSQRSSPDVSEVVEKESYINSGTSVTSEGSDEVSEHDTLGIHCDDDPELGGVLPDAERSVGVVSAITSPSHYIPVNQVFVPGPALSLSIFNEEVPSTNVNVVDGDVVNVDVVNVGGAHVNVGNVAVSDVDVVDKNVVNVVDVVNVDGEIEFVNPSPTIEPSSSW